MAPIDDVGASVGLAVGIDQDRIRKCVVVTEGRSRSGFWAEMIVRQSPANRRASCPRKCSNNLASLRWSPPSCRELVLGVARGHGRCLCFTK